MAVLTGVNAQDAGVEAWKISSLDRHVQDLQHELASQMPILAWSLPDIPPNDLAVKMRKNGELARNVRILWSKGIAPSVDLSAVSQGSGTLDGALAVGTTLRELAIPTHLFANPPAWVGNWAPMKNGRSRHYPWDYWPQGGATWFTYDANFAGERWPVFPLATPSAGYTSFKRLFASLHAGDAAHDLPGVQHAAGLWMDYEDLPYPWNGARASQQHGVINGHPVAAFYDDRNVPFPGGGQSVREKYGIDVLSSGSKLQQYSADLRAWLLDESARKAFLEVYGSEALTGNYGDVFSSPQQPFHDGNDAAYAITLRPGSDGQIAMPVQYANNRYLQKYLGGSNQPDANQENANEVYWYLLLRSFSSSAANAGEHDRSVPWVSQYVREDRSGNFDFPMSVSLYQELLRHFWLRGAMGMYVFNPYRQNVDTANIYMTARHSIAQLEYVRAVLDEMLCFRDFLERGMPMNFRYGSMFDPGSVWSGLALDGDAVVRTVSPNGTAGADIREIEVPNGATFRGLPAPAGGATYLLKKNGEVHRVDARPADLYLQMDQGFLDSSGSDRDTVALQDASVTAGQSLSGDVAGTSILQGTYALYANRANKYSLRLSRESEAPSAGNSLRIDNSDGAFNARSFTAELLIKVLPNADENNASIVSKGLSASAEDADWTLQYRNDESGSGRLHLEFHKDAVTMASMETMSAPMTVDVWHHVAVVYDGVKKQAQVYVDYKLQPWGAHNDQVSATGALDWEFRRHTHDRLVLGRFNRGLNALIDEFRFTSAALDAYQFLKVGSLPRTARGSLNATDSDSDGAALPREQAKTPKPPGLNAAY
ncbi:MAG TPA: LamG-like jellyroll fold domain-containing protein [Steroidobacteraceae bacterium]